MILEKVIGHRGASAYAPENTLVAFEKAYATGCRMIEFDVMLSADGEAFIFHDDVLERTTNGKGGFGVASAEYISGLDAGKWFSSRFRGEIIPTFKEVIEWLAANDMQANIEIKPYPGTAEQTTMTVLAQLNQLWPEHKPLPLVSSFDLNVLNLCRSIAPELPLGLLLEEWHDNWLQLAQDLHCYSVHLNRRLLSQKRIHEIKRYEYKLLTYTVNRRQLAKKLLQWGVDAIFSDYPDLLN